MVKPENKTKQTAVLPEEFLAGVEPSRRRIDGFALLGFFNKVTGMTPRMWGPSIIGYGRYHYRYESGREGDSLMTGFSPRKKALSVYVMPGYRDMSAQLARLGKNKTGKSCLYINKLEDIDMDVLREIIENGLGYLRANYETWDD